MSFTSEANQIFNRAIKDYHLTDDVNTPMKNPYTKDSIQRTEKTHPGIVTDFAQMFAIHDILWYDTNCTFSITEKGLFIGRQTR